MPRHFREDDAEAAVAMMRSTSFGHLTVVGKAGLSSTPLPFLIDDDASIVRAHLARPNPLLNAAPCEALLVVPVSDAYISPGWYPSKREHGKVVPTWNYEVVHVRGSLRTHDDEWTLQLVRDLTDHHEANMPNPWSVDDAPAEHIDKLLRAIVGVSIEVTSVDAKRKLSQNKQAADLLGTIDGLRTLGGERTDAIATAMDQHQPRDTQ